MECGLRVWGMVANVAPLVSPAEKIMQKMGRPEMGPAGINREAQHIPHHLYFYPHLWSWGGGLFLKLPGPDIGGGDEVSPNSDRVKRLDRFINTDRTSASPDGLDPRSDGSDSAEATPIT